MLRCGWTAPAWGTCRSCGGVLVSQTHSCVCPAGSGTGAAAGGQYAMVSMANEVRAAWVNISGRMCGCSAACNAAVAAQRRIPCCLQLPGRFWQGWSKAGLSIWSNRGTHGGQVKQAGSQGGHDSGVACGTHRLRAAAARARHAWRCWCWSAAGARPTAMRRWQCVGRLALLMLRAKVWARSRAQGTMLRAAGAAWRLLTRANACVHRSAAWWAPG